MSDFEIREQVTAKLYRFLGVEKRSYLAWNTGRFDAIDRMDGAKDGYLSPDCAWKYAEDNSKLRRGVSGVSAMLLDDLSKALNNQFINSDSIDDIVHAAKEMININPQEALDIGVIEHLFKIGLGNPAYRPKAWGLIRQIAGQLVTFITSSHGEYLSDDKAQLIKKAIEMLEKMLAAESNQTLSKIRNARYPKDITWFDVNSPENKLKALASTILSRRDISSFRKLNANNKAQIDYVRTVLISLYDSFGAMTSDTPAWVPAGKVAYGFKLQLSDNQIMLLQNALFLTGRITKQEFDSRCIKTGSKGERVCVADRKLTQEKLCGLQNDHNIKSGYTGHKFGIETFQALYKEVYSLIK